MKKERNELVCLLMELGISVGKLLLAVALFFGALYLLGLMVEIISSCVSLALGVFLIFAIAGVLLYIDFRPEVPMRGGRNKVHTESLAKCAEGSSAKGLRAYTGREF